MILLADSEYPDRTAQMFSYGTAHMGGSTVFSLFNPVSLADQTFFLQSV